uniref:CUB domain-containing protein n=1 Tax=Rhabditophanes sp. KR3021 TaxID=114890 RepID=A0AC35UBT3_9BILA
MTPWATTSNNFEDGSCGVSCNADYVQFLPMPVVPKNCNERLMKPDKRVITNDFTTRVYVSPPSVDYDCNEVFTMDIYDKFENISEKSKIISRIGMSRIELTDKSEMASSTVSGQMPMYRFGNYFYH